jgi:large subunit ribosomal protein L24
MMIKSSKPRMQRKYRYTAPMHARQHFLHVHLSKEARQKLGIKARAVQVSKGDTVKIMSGSKRGTTGKVTRVSLRTGSLYIDSYKRKDAKGKELSVPVSASNVYITDLNLSDKLRVSRLKPTQQARSAAPAQKTVPAPKAEQKAESAAVASAESDIHG